MMKVILIQYVVISVLLISFLGSCNPALPDVQIPDVASYQLADDLDLSVVAAEPMIQSPVAMDFDLQGRLWVLEMPGYMANIEGTGENDPVGRIVILEDKDQDGFHETAIPFLEGLRAARAFKLAYGGLLFAEPPNLWFVEINGDQAGQRTLVDSTYVQGGNIEHQPNGLDLNIDNWIYSAKSAFRYRLKDGKWLKEATTFRGQWGISHDDQGRLFYNDNSNPLYGDYYRPNQLNRNEYYNNREGENEVILASRRVYPLQATSVNRGYIKGILDEEGKLKTFTSACGPAIYRGEALGADYQGDVFVCGPEVNLVKRISLKKSDGKILGTNVYEDKEFLISEDEAFRPVNCYTGPDGALYIVDYHHGVIQHKVYMTAYLREQYLSKGLDTIVNYGRILKVQRSADSAPMKWPANNHYHAWVDLLRHPNGWVRDQAQHWLITQNAIASKAALEAMAIDTENPTAVLHALWILEGLDLLDHELLSKVVALGETSSAVCAVQLAQHFYKHNHHHPIFDAALKLRDPKVDWQIAVSAGQVNEKAFVYLQEVLDRYPSDTAYIEAALSGLAGKEDQFLYFLKTVRGKAANYPIFNYLEEIIELRKKGKPSETESVYLDTKTEGLALFRQHCVSCHGENGQGIKNLAPPLQRSEYIKGDSEKLILLTLHGLQGPITVNGQRYELNAVMPGLKDNASLSDQDIANLLSFVRNAFADDYVDIKAEEVKAGRDKLPKGKMYTEGELELESKFQSKSK